MIELKWSKAPEDQQEEWDEIYRAIGALMILNNIPSAYTVIEYEGQPIKITINMEYMGPVQ
jgi:hypothetical protein